MATGIASITAINMVTQTVKRKKTKSKFISSKDNLKLLNSGILGR